MAQPVILAIWEAEIGRIEVQGETRQTVCKTNLQNNQSKVEWRCGPRDRAPALQARSPEFKLHSYQKKSNYNGVS
jgi:hypothetical protein